MVPNIEKLDLEGCSRLRKVHETVGYLEGITVLNLKGCKNLQSFPNKIYGLKSLKILNLQGCSKLDKLPQNLGELQCLEELDASGTAIKQVPPSIARLTNLKTLEIPEWFSCRSDVNSVGIGLPPNWLNDEFMGIAMCAVIAPDPENLNDIRSVVCKMCIMRNKHPFHFYIPRFTTVESEHLWLVYASCEKFEHERSYQISRYLDYLQKVKLDPSYELPDINCRDLYVSVSNSTCIHAEFGVSTQAKNSNSKVIKCGIRPVYKKDIECFEESPPAESSKLHQSHNCSTGYHSSSTGWHMPTKLEYHCNIRRDYSGVGQYTDFDRPEDSDSDEE
ncbi:hypothetical protein JRO89_XS07G0284100 [Xanthoceras sorbifolium]|uniref:C-JID domain-containing protein n=1 Tax=Xanthoceras sorbifolium TaxID=99658 RepID=A0ABQ8HVI2_9ROSI|nr:hypothetical protein JRO89_XS07G0284100 [Xanthoceras sorbifolium]